MLYSLIPIGFLIGATIGTVQKKKRQSIQINFVPDKTKEALFSSKKIEIEKDVRCSVCGKIITMENIGIFTRRAGKNIYICNSLHCSKFAQLGIHSFNQAGY